MLSNGSWRRRFAGLAIVSLLVGVAPTGLLLAQELAPGSQAQVVKTGSDGLRVRGNPSLGGQVLDVAYEGEVVTVVGEQTTDANGRSWVKVKVGEGTGWASQDFLAPAAPEAERRGGTARAGRDEDAGSSIATLAARLVGYRYRFGGSSPVTGFDCSGLVYYVFAQHGIYLPRSTWSQWQVGRRVKSGELQSGDLVFFENTYTWGLSHVGIYVGGGRFIDAGTERTGVHYSNLWDPYWSARFVGGRRVR